MSETASTETARSRQMSLTLARLFKMQRGACALLLVAMVVLIASEVVLRSIFGRSLEFTEDVAGYLLVGAGFLGFGVALIDGEIFTVDFIYKALPRRLQTFLQIGFDVIAIIVSVVITWQLCAFVLSSYRRGIVETSALAMPLWLPQLVMPIGSFLLIVALLVRLHWDLTSERRRTGAVS